MSSGVPQVPDLVEEMEGRRILSIERAVIEKTLDGLTPKIEKYALDTLKREVRGAFGKALSALGVTELEVATKLKQLLSAKKYTVLTDKDGNHIQTIETDDPATQLRAVQLIIAIGGYNAPIKINHKSSIELHANPDDLKALREKERQLKKIVPADFEVLKDERVAV